MELMMDGIRSYRMQTSEEKEEIVEYEFYFDFLFFSFFAYKTALIFRFIFRKSHLSIPTPDMSSQPTTSYATVSVPTVPNNYLNTEVHINYNKSLHSIQEQCCAMLLTMNHPTHVQEMA
jgi:hypothetical protein